MARANYEPSARARVIAKQLFDMYAALKLEGFDENQALSIIAMVIHSNAAYPGDD